MWGPIETLTAGCRLEVLVVVAHPDDEALVCGATVASLTAAGASVQIACVGDGPADRLELFPKACAVLGADAVFPVPAGAGTEVVLDRALVGAVDRLIGDRVPDLVITHSRSGPQHQEHVAVHDAVRLSVARWQRPAMVLAAEPPIATPEFAPHVFVDVDTGFDAKLDAVAQYRKVIDRRYLDDDYLVQRARWWGQVSGYPGRLCEAYELILWR